MKVIRTDAARLSDIETKIDALRGMMFVMLIAQTGILIMLLGLLLPG